MTNEWTPWQVVPDAGFEVAETSGQVGLKQITRSDFLVDGAFRFSNPTVEQDLVKQLIDDGVAEADARVLVDNARNFTPSDSPTNLASVPSFMQWFESPYGNHTLAALIHDELIVDEPNGGALESDTLADRFFRKMLGASGIPWVKRWIMWGAVALRSRWAANGWRRITLIVWILAAIAGTSVFAAGLLNTAASGLVPTSTWWFHGAAAVLVGVSGLVRTWSSKIGQVMAIVGALAAAIGAYQAIDAGAVSGSSWLMFIAGAVLPVLSAPLWGKQWGASLVAAVAGIFVIPAGAFVVLGLGIYSFLEGTASAVRD